MAESSFGRPSGVPIAYVVWLLAVSACAGGIDSEVIEGGHDAGGGDPYTQSAFQDRPLVAGDLVGVWVGQLTVASLIEMSLGFGVMLDKQGNPFLTDRTGGSLDFADLAYSEDGSLQLEMTFPDPQLESGQSILRLDGRMSAARDRMAGRLTLPVAMVGETLLEAPGTWEVYRSNQVD